MYESLLSTVFQSITYEIATISAYKMNVIRICHHSIICLFFSWGTWHLSADYIWSSKRTWILPALQHNRKKPTGSSTLSNVITTSTHSSHFSPWRTSMSEVQFIPPPWILGVGLPKAPKQQVAVMGRTRCPVAERAQEFHPFQKPTPRHRQCQEHQWVRVL